MPGPITEIEARQVLMMGTPILGEEWQASRLEGGWAFEYCPGDGVIRFGNREIVVADNKALTACDLGESGQEAIDRLLAPPSWWARLKKRLTG